MISFGQSITIWIQCRNFTLVLLRSTFHISFVFICNVVWVSRSKTEHMMWRSRPSVRRSYSQRLNRLPDIRKFSVEKLFTKLVEHTRVLWKVVKLSEIQYRRFSHTSVMCMNKILSLNFTYFVRCGSHFYSRRVQKLIKRFHCFTVHFDSLSFIHTNSCTFSYNYVSVI